MSGRIEIEQEPGTGLIIVRGFGLWSIEQAMAHFDRMEAMLLRGRKPGRPICVLSDMREAQVQTRETSVAMMERLGRIHRDGDRVAYVGSSRLHLMQVRRDVKAAEVRAFEDMATARAWLLEALAG